MTIGGGDVWIAGGTATDQVFRIDPATNEVVASIDVERPINIEASGDSVWQSHAGNGGEVVRVSYGDGRPVQAENVTATDS